MITRPTVLILGAGASCPFDLPSGKELFDSICTELKMPELSDIGMLLISCGYRSHDLTEFAECLLHSGLSSIDRFLEHQEAGWVELGKHAIAASLLPREKPDLLFRDTVHNPNWLKTLFRCINGPVDTFEQNELTVITYNYDRSVEQFLFTSLKSIYNLDDAHCASAIQKIPVIHLHGLLSPIIGKPGTIVGYGEEISTLRVQGCARNIRIIHESIEGIAEFDQAHKAIQDAEIIAFLGFGYNKTNLVRLLSPNIRPGRRPDVFASVCGFGAAEIQAIKSYLDRYFGTGRVFVGSPTQDISRMLHDYPILPFL